MTLSVLGSALLALAFVSAALYLLQFRELKTKRFGQVFQLFPPLERLDRLNYGALAIAFPALAAGGFGYLAGVTRATTLLQLEVSEHERGRVMALWSVAFLGSRPIASVIDGGVAALAGPRVATMVMVIPSLVVAAMLFRGGSNPPASTSDPAPSSARG